MDRLVQLPFGLLTLSLMVLPAVATETDQKPQPPRSVSPHLSEMIAAALPKYEPPLVGAPLAPSLEFPAANAAEPHAPTGATDPIVRLPDFVVGGQKLPLAEDVMTKTEREKFAVRKYLGDEQDLNRALNMVTVVGLWRKIPVLGKLPFVVGQFSSRSAVLTATPATNEERAMSRYGKEKAAQQMADLSSLLSPQLKPSAAPPPQK